MATERSSRPERPLFSGDRATAPAALEEFSASAWQRFEDLQKVQAAPFEATKPYEPGASPTGFGPTQPMGPLQAAAPNVPPPQRRAPTLDEVMLMARRNNRACPRPVQWAAFHALLPTRVGAGRTLSAPLPVDGPAWAVTSAMQKRMRLRDQIEWAERVGALLAAYDFLAALPEEEWHHTSD